MGSDFHFKKLRKKRLSVLGKLTEENNIRRAHWIKRGPGGACWETSPLHSNFVGEKSYPSGYGKRNLDSKTNTTPSPNLQYGPAVKVFCGSRGPEIVRNDWPGFGVTWGPCLTLPEWAGFWDYVTQRFRLELNTAGKKKKDKSKKAKKKENKRIIRRFASWEWQHKQTSPALDGVKRN